VNSHGYRFIPQFLKSRQMEKRGPFRPLASIAVLPVTMTGPEDLLHRCDQITFHMVAGLSAFRHRVVALATLKSHKIDRTAPQQAGEMLGVDAVISGELMRSSGTLFFTTELIDVSDGTQICGAHSEAPDLEGSRCEEQLARDVLQQFRPVLAPVDENPQLTFDGPGFSPLQNGSPVPRRRASDFLV
jgi:TolB-like protein